MSSVDITQQLKEAIDFSRSGDVEKAWSATKAALSRLSTTGLSSKQDFYIAVIIDFMRQNGAEAHIIELFSIVRGQYLLMRSGGDSQHFAVNAYAKAMNALNKASQAVEKINDIANFRIKEYGSEDKIYQQLLALVRSLQSNAIDQETPKCKSYYLHTATGLRMIERSEPLQYRKQLKEMFRNKAAVRAERSNKAPIISVTSQSAKRACFFCKSQSDIIAYCSIGEANFCGNCLVAISEVRPKIGDKSTRANDRFFFSDQKGCSFCDAPLNVTTRWIQDPALAICPICAPAHNYNFPDVFCSFCSAKIYAPDLSKMERRPRTMTTPTYWCPNCREERETVREMLKRKFGNEFIDLNAVVLTPECQNLLPARWVCIHKAIPVKMESDSLFIAIVNPFDYIVRGQISEMFPNEPERFLKFLVCEEEAFDEFAIALYGKKITDEAEIERRNLLSPITFVLLYSFASDIVNTPIYPSRIKKRLEPNRRTGIVGYQHV